MAPLNYFPYNGPPIRPSDIGSTPSKQQTETAEEDGPASVFIPFHSTIEEEDKILSATKSGITLTGSAALRALGPDLGILDIGESETSYLFRVSLPGVSMDEKDFSCDVDPDGEITIKGVSTTGGRTVRKNPRVYKMLAQNLWPPGDFSITFQLPGPVNNQQFNGDFTDGIFTGVVKKK